MEHVGHKREFAPIAVAIAIVAAVVGGNAEGAQIFRRAGKEGPACNLVIMGTIEERDDAAFSGLLATLLREGCTSPNVHLYSEGGNLGVAMKIGEDIHRLQLMTVAPMLYLDAGMADELRPRDGARICHFLPGSTERDAREMAAASEYSKAVGRAIQARARLPKAPARYGDYDPATGAGDPRCSCASACFFIWAAGSERMGDVVQIHRPTFGPKWRESEHIDLKNTREFFQTMLANAREYLGRMDVPVSLIDRMFAVDSGRAIYLSGSDIKSMAMTPHWDELRTLQCGPAPPEIEPPLPSDSG